LLLIFFVFLRVLFVSFVGSLIYPLYCFAFFCLGLVPSLYVTEDTYTVFFDDAVEDVLAYLAGDPVRVL